MDVEIRPYAAGDTDVIVALSLRAWAPVFDSLRSALGPELFVVLRGADWREGQAADVRDAIGADGAQTWVAQVDRTVRGFVTAALSPAASLGEIVMVAVEPDYQRQGLGRALVDVATEWLREHGATTVMVEAGGDEGHAPARAAYEQAGFHPLPVTRYFKTL